MSLPALKTSESPSLFVSLNPEQRKAVETTDGPVLVLAGAGTGKTRVLTTRLAYILEQGKARPYEVLAVTFTNKAAREMKERVAGIVGGIIDGMWLGTFHALCTRIIRAHAEKLGLNSSFTILDTDDQIRLMKQIMEAERIDDKNWPAKNLMGQIQRWKDQALTPAQAMKNFGRGERGWIARLYHLYQERLQNLNAVDFGDLLLYPIHLFMSEPDVLESYQKKFKYILVDEYQDTNVAQYMWLRLLAQTHHNICCVGDDDQSIYSWRGAEVANILRFEQDFPDCATIRLEQNYRSTSPILDCATSLIANNTKRLEKTLWTETEGGEKIRIQPMWDGQEEARLIAHEIERLRLEGHPLKEVAILVRAGFQTREFEERFITIGLPYKVVGGLRFYERQEIRDAIAYFRVVTQPRDSLAFERIINVPKRAIGPQTIKLLHDVARDAQISLYEAAQSMMGTSELRPKVQESLGQFLRDCERWQGQIETLPAQQLAEIILDESGYTSMWKSDKSPEAPGRLENLKELVQALSEFESLAAFLEHVSLVMDNAADDNGDQVNVMTLHSAKGLEFETVFLPGWEEGVFPHQKALDEAGSSGLEEERRLAYVGITRAKKNAVISYAARRRIYNNWQTAYPSRFISELPQDSILELKQKGMMSRQSNTYFAPKKTLYYDEDTQNTQDHWEDMSQEVDVVIGTQVTHKRFGRGVIVGIEGQRLDVNFETGGLKKVLANFIEKAW